MEINVHAEIGACSEFVGADGEKKTITVAIAPLKIQMNEAQDKLAIISGCNMWRSCSNGGCYYSQESRNKKGSGGKGQPEP